MEYQIALLSNDNSSRSRQLEDLQDDNQYLNKQHDSTSRRIEELEDDNKYVKRQLQLARPSQRTAALLSCRAADDLLKRITPEMIQRATLDVSQDSRNEKNSAAHNIDVETAIEIWAPRGTTSIPSMPLRDDMVTFTIKFGLSSADYAKFAHNDDLMNVFKVNQALNNHSKLVLNFAMDKFRARYSVWLKAARKYCNDTDIDDRFANRLCDDLEDAYHDDWESAIQ